jgi:pilus assembly protein CpaB
MQLRTILVGVLALVFSGTAALGMYLFARQPKGEADIETVSVVVAAVPVSRGVTLSAEVLQTRDWPKNYVPEGALLLVEEAAGRTVWIPLIANDPVVESKLATKDAGRGMAALIPPGMRAVTIQTPNVATGVAGFILPGNKVDVLWTYSQVGKNDETGGGSTITLLQNVEILAVDQQIDIPNENKTQLGEMRSVTLLVSPSDASKLDLGQNRGTLRLSLRNPKDTVNDEIETITLLGMQRSAGQPFVSAMSSETSQGGALTSAEPVLPEMVPAPARFPDTLLSIRTLRGTSSGIVYLRQQPEIQVAGRQQGLPDVPLRAGSEVHGQRGEGEGESALRQQVGAANGSRRSDGRRADVTVQATLDRGGDVADGEDAAGDAADLPQVR